MRVSASVLALVAALAVVVSRRSYISRIIVRELASGMVNMPPEVLGKMSYMLNTYNEIIEEGKRQGVFSCTTAA